ncbi:MAG: MarR family transcriptional regulator [Bacteroidota bacterium]
MVKYNNWNETLKNRYSLIYHKLLSHKEIDISVIQYAYLDIIRRYPSENLSRQRISEFLGVTKKTVTNISNKMIKKGFIGINQEKCKVLTDKFLNYYEDEEQRGKSFTKLEFSEAEKLGITPEEFCILDSIYYFIRKKRKRSKFKLAEVINQNERNIYNILTHLEAKGYIIRKLKKIYPVPTIMVLFIRLREPAIKGSF